MVVRLLWLKTRLFWNGLRADPQRRVGLPATFLALAAAAWYLQDLYRRTMEGLGEAAALEFSLWAALGFFLVWVTLPVVVFPLDEHLDPAQFALAPIPSGRLVTGLAAAGLASPSMVVPLVLLGTNLVVFRRVFGAALLAGLLYLGLLVIAGQLFTAAVSAVLRTRHGRNLAVLMVAAVGVGGLAAQQLIRSRIERLGLEQAVLSYPVSAWLVPPVAAQRIVTGAAAGSPSQSVLSAVVVLAWIAAMAWAWRRLLTWMLTSPAHHGRPSRRSRSDGFAGGLLWGPVSVLARKELRFYLRDHRQRLVWTGAVIFVGLAIASILAGMGNMAALRQREWLPLFAPMVVLFVGLPIVLNLFGWERNAASFLFVLPVPPRYLLAGKNLAAVIALALEAAVMGVFLAWISDGWHMLVFLPSLWVAAVGSQLAVGNLVSVLTPLRLPREGTDVFSQATEQGCLAIAAQAVAFLTIGLLLALPVSVLVLAVSFGRAIPPWFAHGFLVAWGGTAYILSLWLTGRLLGRRTPEVVNWVELV